VEKKIEEKLNINKIKAFFIELVNIQTGIKY